VEGYWQGKVQRSEFLKWDNELKFKPNINMEVARPWETDFS